MSCRPTPPLLLALAFLVPPSAAFAQGAAPDEAPPAGAPTEPPAEGAPDQGTGAAAAKKGAQGGEKKDEKGEEKGDEGKEQQGEAPPSGATPPPEAPAESPAPEPSPTATPAPSTPVEPPVTPAAPVAPAAPSPPMASAPVAPPPPADEGPEEQELPPPEMTLGLEVDAGFNAQLGDSSTTLEREEPVDATYGVGLWFAPQRLWSVGLSYQRIGLGGEETPPSADSSLSVQRDIDSLWLGGRAYPVRTDDVGLYVGLHLGLSWQSLKANGTTPPKVQSVTPGGLYSCEASDGPSFALGGAIGVDVDMSRSAGFIAQVDANGHRLTSDPLDGKCSAPGAGSTTNLGGRIGFIYRFDLGGEKPGRATAASSDRR